MPELPEVETVKRGLESLLDFPVKIVSAESSSKALRFRYPRGFKNKLVGQTVRSIGRRAKYLIFDLGENSFICHLGMTGNWRRDSQFDPSAHDHFHLKLEGDVQLIYNDVRRFGYFDYIANQDLAGSRWFAKLGPEPFADKGLSVDWLQKKFSGRTASVKSLVMNQEVVVGVGNIYASEALFLAGISPKTPAGKLKPKQLQVLVSAIETVISSAIKSGGTTIRDFKNAGGSQGYFQTQLNVYGRKGEPCRTCGRKIKSETIVGRSTYWCTRCQK